MKTKRALAWGFHAVGITSLARRWHRKDVVVLNYHSVSDRCPESDPLDLNVSLKSFLSQMAQLRRGHNVISLSEFVNAIERQVTLPNYPVVLTFDDGYKDFLTVAPLLIEQKLPATLFLVTDMLKDERPSTENNGKERLTWKDVQTLDQYNLFEFGSHTCSHSSIPNLTPAAFDHELRDSLEILQSQLKNSFSALAYPNGAYAGLSTERVAAAGYRCALTIDPGANKTEANPYFLRRQTIHGSDNEQMFAARLSCLTDSFYSGRVLMSTLLGLVQSWVSWRPVSLGND